MDDSRQPSPRPNHPLSGPHWNKVTAAEVAADFNPLRLVLHPHGVVIELTRPDMVLGRHSQADVRLQQPDVSRHHCRFVFAEGAWQVIDLHSLNGLFVNGERVPQAALQDGDVLRIGSFILEVDMSSGSANPKVSAPAPAKRQAS